MKKRYFVSFIIVLLLFGCSNDDDFIQQIQLSGKTFDHLLFDTEQKCIDAQPDPNFFINCHQEISFIDKTNATIIFTDIVYPVTYRIDSNVITINSDIENDGFLNSLVFEIISSSSIRLLDNDTIWNERKGDSIWD